MIAAYDARCIVIVGGGGKRLIVMQVMMMMMQMMVMMMMVMVYGGCGPCCCAVGGGKNVMLLTMLHQIAGKQIDRTEDPVAKQRHGDEYSKGFFRLISNETGTCWDNRKKNIARLESAKIFVVKNIIYRVGFRKRGFL